MTRSEPKQAMLDGLGAVPVVADALDPGQVAEAAARARPDVIVHQLTAIGSLDPRHFDRDFAPASRLRAEGTDHLLSAGQAVGVRRFVAQRNGAFPCARTGGTVKGEEDPLDPSPVSEMRAMVAAIRHLEEAALGGKQPVRVPRFVAGEAGAVPMTELRGASNAKAKRELGWQPRHPSWRRGFAA